MLACVLASGAGLLSFGMVSLWRAAQDAEARAHQVAMTQAQGALRSLRERWAEPGALADKVWSFTVADRALVVPDDVLWLHAPPEVEEQLSPAVGATRREVRDAEFKARDPSRALALLQAALTSATDPLSERALRLSLAFTALRLGDTAALDAQWPHFASAPTPAYAFVAETALLAAAVRRPIPAYALRVLPSLWPERVTAVVDRLVEIDPSFDAAPHHAALAQVQSERAHLVAVSSVLPELLAANTPQQRLHGTDLLLWWPTSGGAGRGVLAPAEELCAHLGGELWREAELRLVYGDTLPADALPIVAGLAAVVSTQASAAARPIALTALLATLALLFVLGLGFTIVALRREAAANAARGEFLVSVTHELKTPIAAMRLLAEMLDEGRVRTDEQRRDYYRMLAGESLRLQALVDNVLDLGRLERGERALDLRPCALGDIVRHAVEVFAPVATRDGREVTLRGDDLLATVCADRMALTQALLNVFDNARKYAPHGPLAVELRVVAEQAQVQVRDQGPGVPHDERERIFERFVRGARQRSGSVPGVGLGLYLARTIAIAHGGSLTCETPDGPGALFRFTFPLQRSAEVVSL